MKEQPPMPTLEKKKTNQELLVETRNEYPKFENFWYAIIEQAKIGKAEVYFGDNPSPLNVVRLLATKLSTIREWNNVYLSELEENPKAEMPVDVYIRCMKMQQEAMGVASDVYYGEAEILNSEGRIKSIL